MTKSYVSGEEKLLTDLVALLESNDLPPWRKPWAGHHGEHRNLITGKPYQGVNPLLLEMGLLIRETDSVLWCGSGQAKALGWFPKKGSKGVRILRPQLNSREMVDGDGKPQLDGEGQPLVSAWVSYKPVVVFNASDLTGGNDEATAELNKRIATELGAVQLPAGDEDRVLDAEKHLWTWPVPTNFGGTRACYSSSLDRISMPLAESFESRESFCSTWLHEQAHSTGHSSRLDRKLGNQFGSAAYAREELIAELASVLACYRLKISYDLPQHASYMSSWAKALKEGGAKELMKVLKEARMAADLIAPEVGGEVEL